MNSNEQRLKDVFAEALRIPANEIDDTLAYETASSWDSVAHMGIIAALDSTFDIMIDTDDVIDMSSFGKAKEILAKYGVQF
jgi:acyl carrier protein